MNLEHGEDAVFCVDSEYLTVYILRILRWIIRESMHCGTGYEWQRMLILENVFYGEECDWKCIGAFV